MDSNRYINSQCNILIKLLMRKEEELKVKVLNSILRENI